MVEVTVIERTRQVMEHGVGSYMGLNEIRSPMMNFITINYLFTYIFSFIY